MLDAVARVLRAQRPTYDGTIAPANELARAVQSLRVECTRDTPAEVRGEFYSLTVLRVGSNYSRASQVVELSFAGREFRDSIPIWAGSRVRIPRGLTAFWVRGGVNPAYGDAEATDAEFVLTRDPHTHFDGPVPVDLPAACIFAGNVAMPLVSNNVLLEAPLCTRGPVRCVADVVFEPLGGGPDIPLTATINLESVGVCAAGAVAVHASDPVAHVHLDSCVPVHASLGTAFNASWVRVYGSRPGGVGTARALSVSLSVQPVPQGATAVVAV